MSSNRFRQIALGLPGVIEGSHQGQETALILHRINFLSRLSVAVPRLFFERASA
jgi:hypothetical protein